MTDDIRFPPDCESVIRALWDYLDSELEEGETARIHEHLDACGHCRAHADFEHRLVNELASLREQNTDPSELRARVERALREAGAGPRD